MEKQESIKNQINTEQVNVYRNKLKEQYFEVKKWKMRVDMISSLREKEIEMKDRKIIEMVCFYKLYLLLFYKYRILQHHLQ